MEMNFLGGHRLLSQYPSVGTSISLCRNFYLPREPSLLSWVLMLDEISTSPILVVSSFTSDLVTQCAFSLVVRCSSCLESCWGNEQKRHAQFHWIMKYCDRIFLGKIYNSFVSGIFKILKTLLLRKQILENLGTLFFYFFLSCTPALVNESRRKQMRTW